MGINYTKKESETIDQPYSIEEARREEINLILLSRLSQRDYRTEKEEREYRSKGHNTPIPRKSKKDSLLSRVYHAWSNLFANKTPERPN